MTGATSTWCVALVCDQVALESLVLQDQSQQQLLPAAL